MKKEVDLIVTNGVIYTVDDSFSIAEALAVKNQRIVAVGNAAEINQRFKSDNVVNLQGKFVYPGWIDSHCHFYGYGLDLNEVDLTGTASQEGIISRIKESREGNGAGWIIGRGWDQNDWPVTDFPDKHFLDKYFPDTPVFLKRVDGHAAWVNTRALEIAGITSHVKVEGGDVLVKNNEPTGILIDNAIDLVSKFIPAPGIQEQEEALVRAQENCFAVGLTSVHDAGLSFITVKLIENLQADGRLKMRINVMLTPSKENLDTYLVEGPIQNDHLRIGTIKLYADGALGSRGALMIEPYSDDPGNSGLLLTPEEDLRSYCELAFHNNFQVATHCIGDGGNRIMLHIYGDILKGTNDRRWRIEHAQIIQPDDIPLFGRYNIIPSVQSTHATSDMYWAEKRIGKERMEGAYAYKRLLEHNVWIPNGSDFPVEDINPLLGFYASVVRKDTSGFPENGFQMENALTREEALKSMTIWAARSAFEEELKGSLEAGKLADFVVTDQDIMKVPDDGLFRIKVDATYSGGEKVYSK